MMLHKQLKDYRIILASQSPRRKFLLEGLDIPFEILVRPDIPEDVPEGMPMMEIPVHLAKAKSDYYTDLLTDKTIIITADTIVWLNNKLVGKPENLEDAERIIGELSGRTHEVVTGVCLRSRDSVKTFSSLSTVHFRELSSEEIGYYTQQYKPLDKAGAYGIQEWIGYVGIERIDGSFYNVMGLPVQVLYQELKSFVGN